jgi:hypothetical protein
MMGGQTPSTDFIPKELNVYFWHMLDCFLRGQVTTPRVQKKIEFGPKLYIFFFNKNKMGGVKGLDENETQRHGERRINKQWLIKVLVKGIKGSELGK